ncbi:phospholipase A [Moritella viscosa]
MNACLSSNVTSVKGTMTVEALRTFCHEVKPNPLHQRRALEKSAENNPFALIPYKPNYILPVTYSKGRTEPYKNLDSEYDFDDVEIKFQVSLKYIVAEDFMTPGFDVQLAFTSVSWWQAYNSDSSSPFRETNYEPEMIFQYSEPWDLSWITCRHHCAFFKSSI